MGGGTVQVASSSPRLWKNSKYSGPLLGHIGPHSLNVKLKLKDMMVRLHYKAIHKAKNIPASWTSVSDS